MRLIVIAAILCSLLLHVALIIVIGGIQITLPDWRKPVSAFFEIPEIVIPTASNQTPTAEAERMSHLDPDHFPEVLEEKEFDLSELQNRIPEDREISITPNVTRPENIANGNAEELSSASMAKGDFEETLATVAQSALPPPDFTAALSETQPLIDADPNGKDSAKTRDLIEKAAKGTQDGNGQYNSLDQLIGIPGGKITDISKPIYMPSDLLFDFREDRLREGAKTSLMMLGILIDRNPDTIFVIEGHTDTIGSEENNLDLSRRRAKAVSDWLQQSLRIPPGRIQTEGLGEAKPLVAPTGTIDEQQPNRRVEIHMLRAAKATETGTPPTPTAPAAPVVLPARPIEP